METQTKSFMIVPKFVAPLLFYTVSLYDVVIHNKEAHNWIIYHHVSSFHTNIYHFLHIILKIAHWITNVVIALGFCLWCIISSKSRF